MCRNLHSAFALLMMAIALAISACSGDEGSRGCLAGGACGGDVTVTDESTLSTISLDSTTSTLSDTSNVIQPTSGFSCTATPYPAVINSGQTVRLEVKTFGRSGTKRIPGPAGQGDYVSSFGDVVNLFGIYRNDAALGVRIVEQKVHIVENSTGAYTFCAFRVEVRNPQYIRQNPLACKITVSPSIVKLNDEATFTFTATNDVTRADFSRFWPNDSKSVNDSDLVRVDPHTMSARIRLDVQGPKTASVTVRDQAGQQAVCSLALDVAAQSEIVATASPGTTVLVNNPIVLAASLRGVVSPTSYSWDFITSDPEASITKSGAMATITSTKADKTISHSFVVRISASGTGLTSLTKDVTVTFSPTVGPSSLVSCNLLSKEEGAASYNASSKAGTNTILEAFVQGGAGPFSVSILDVALVSSGAFTPIAVTDSVDPSSSLRRKIVISQSGLLRISAKVTDESNGQFVNCSSFHSSTP